MRVLAGFANSPQKGRSLHLTNCPQARRPLRQIQAQSGQLPNRLTQCQRGTAIGPYLDSIS